MRKKTSSTIIFSIIFYTLLWVSVPPKCSATEKNAIEKLNTLTELETIYTKNPHSFISNEILEEICPQSHTFQTLMTNLIENNCIKQLNLKQEARENLTALLKRYKTLHRRCFLPYFHHLIKNKINDITENYFKAILSCKNNGFLEERILKENDFDILSNEQKEIFRPSTSSEKYVLLLATTDFKIASLRKGNFFSSYSLEDITKLRAKFVNYIKGNTPQEFNLSKDDLSVIFFEAQDKFYNCKDIRPILHQNDTPLFAKPLIPLLIQHINTLEEPYPFDLFMSRILYTPLLGFYRSILSPNYFFATAPDENFAFTPAVLNHTFKKYIQSNKENLIFIEYAPGGGEFCTNFLLHLVKSLRGNILKFPEKRTLGQNFKYFIIDNAEDTIALSRLNLLLKNCKNWLEEEHEETFPEISEALDNVKIVKSLEEVEFDPSKSFVNVFSNELLDAFVAKAYIYHPDEKYYELGITLGNTDTSVNFKPILTKPASEAVLKFNEPEAKQSLFIDHRDHVTFLKNVITFLNKKEVKFNFITFDYTSKNNSIRTYTFESEVIIPLSGVSLKNLYLIPFDITYDVNFDILRRELEKEKKNINNLKITLESQSDFIKREIAPFDVTSKSLDKKWYVLHKALHFTNL